MDNGIYELDNIEGKVASFTPLDRCVFFDTFHDVLSLANDIEADYFKDF